MLHPASPSTAPPHIIKSKYYRRDKRAFKTLFEQENDIQLTQSLAGKSIANMAMMLVCKKADFYSSLFFGFLFSLEVFGPNTNLNLITSLSTWHLPLVWIFLPAHFSHFAVPHTFDWAAFVLPPPGEDSQITFPHLLFNHCLLLLFLFLLSHWLSLFDPLTMSIALPIPRSRLRVDSHILIAYYPDLRN